MAAALALFVIVQMTLFDNFHEVIPGEFYRSAQPSTADLEQYVRDHHIRTVINLRGPSERQGWYKDELAASQRLGVRHLDFRMSAERELSDAEANELIATMRDAPKPLLIHCRSGADRTGLASALYLAAIAKRSEWASERQMWVIYGHIPFRISAAHAMNATFERLEPLFGFTNS